MNIPIYPQQNVVTIQYESHPLLKDKNQIPPVSNESTRSNILQKCLPRPRIQPDPVRFVVQSTTY